MDAERYRQMSAQERAREIEARELHGGTTVVLGYNNIPFRITPDGFDPAPILGHSPLCATPVERQRAFPALVISRAALPFDVGTAQHQTSETPGIDGRLERTGTCRKAGLKDRGDFHTRLFGGVEQGIDPFDADLQRLFDDQMLARRNPLQGWFQMRATGRDDTRHLNPRMREKSPGISGVKRNLVRLGKRGSLFLRTPQHADQPDMMRRRQCGNGLDVIAGNHASADQTKTDGFFPA